MTILLEKNMLLKSLC